jgi:sulfite exporter TauE/SafE
MEWWPAFVLGLVGSLHCAGMCGPLALAMPQEGGNGWFVSTRLLYNLGRIVTYSLLGVAFGLVGKSFSVAGLQQFISIVAGALFLVGCLASNKVSANSKVYGWVHQLKAQFAKALFRRTFSSFILLGLLNGLLPCGLVYVACAGAATTGSILESILFMFLFGLGTVPVMLAIALSGKKVQFATRLKLQRLIPAFMIFAGVILIIRGMGLGIPYLSPDLMAKASCCHQ